MICTLSIHAVNKYLNRCKFHFIIYCLKNKKKIYQVNTYFSILNKNHLNMQNSQSGQKCKM